MLLMERRTFGYVTDTLIVYERIAGTVLALQDLDALANRRATRSSADSAAHCGDLKTAVWRNSTRRAPTG
jgi:hypothetical protein